MNTRVAQIKGSMVALVTPMNNDGSIDYPSFYHLIDWHIEQGTNALVIAGTTGESATLDFAEHEQLLREAVRHVKGRVPVIAGTGANATAEAIKLARFAKEIGADAHLSVVPYYNKPMQEGMYQHFKAIADAVDLPMILYNVPGRTVADLLPSTVVRLAQHRNIMGIKESTAQVERAAFLLRDCPKGFTVYSGDDAAALAIMLLGGHGVISVTANVAPKLMADMSRAALEGRTQDAVACNNQLLALHRDLFCEANPIPVKWALQQMGKIQEGMRLPLTLLDATFHGKVKAALNEAGIAI